MLRKKLVRPASNKALTEKELLSIIGGAGSVVDGTFTYKPDSSWSHEGGVDSFEVKVSDNPGNVHIHGLTGLISGN